MGDYVFQSKRLGFRLVSLTDLEDIVKMNQDPEVMTYFPATMTREESVIFMEKVRQHQQNNGYSLFAVELLTSGEFIGLVGLLTVNFDSEIKDEVEIGWRLQKQFWGQGYATEAAEAVLDYGFKVLGLTSIYSFTATINTPSEAVMKRIGMTYLGKFQHPNVAAGHLLKEHVLYKKTVD